MPLEEAVILQGMTRDAAYAGHLLTDLQILKEEAPVSSISFCLNPFLSLYVHESLAKLKAIDPAISAVLSGGVQQIVARSRHRLKLFEDTQRGIDGQLDYFRDTLVSAHRGHFLGSVRFKALQFLAKDLGLFRYGGRLIPAYFPTHDDKTFAAAIDTSIAEATTVMDEWSILD